jgi:hypothetical protein
MQDLIVQAVDLGRLRGRDIGLAEQTQIVLPGL